MQMGDICQSAGIPFINLGRLTFIKQKFLIDDFEAEVHNLNELGLMIQQNEPKILLCSIENVDDPIVQKQIQNLQIAYVAVDEAQVSFSEYAQVYRRIYHFTEVNACSIKADPKS